jgi:hypothetical protein
MPNFFRKTLRKVSFGRQKPRNIILRRILGEVDSGDGRWMLMA